MRDFVKISPKIWDSRKFGKIGDDARLAYFYLHTCKSVNSVGCFVLKEGYALADLGWTAERYANAIDTLCEAYLISIDRGEDIVRIVNYMTFNSFMNPKHASGSIKIAAALPNSPEKLNVLKDLAGCKYAEDNDDLHDIIDTLSIQYRYTETYTETETESPLDFSEKEKANSDSNSLFGDDQKKPPEKKKRACQLPEHWVPNEKNIADAKKIDFTDWEIENEGNQFRDYHHARASKFVDWDATWRTWIRNAIKFGRRTGAQNGGGMGVDAKAAEIADRSLRYAQDRVARREAERDAGSGLSQD